MRARGERRVSYVGWLQAITPATAPRWLTSGTFGDMGSQESGPSARGAPCPSEREAEDLAR